MRFYVCYKKRYIKKSLLPNGRINIGCDTSLPNNPNKPISGKNLQQLLLTDVNGKVLAMTSVSLRCCLLW